MVFLRAGNELLLGKLNKLALPDKVSSFHRSDSREGPARSALALVLDGGDGSLGHPVDSISVRGGELSDVHRSDSDSLLVSHESLVLSFSPVRHLIVTSSVGLLGAVVFLDKLLSSRELQQAELVLLDGTVGLAMLSNELHESVFDLRDDGGGSGSEKSSGNE